MPHTNLTRLTIGSLVLTTALLGCPASPERGGGGDTKPDAGVPTDGGNNNNDPVTGEVVATELIQAFCEYVLSCGQMPFGDVATCAAALGASDDRGINSLSSIQGTVNAGKAETTESKLDACLAAIKTLGCDTRFEGDLRSIPACDAAFTGKVAGGGACINDIACASGSRCFNAEDSANECLATCETLGTKCRADADCTGGKVCDNRTCATPTQPPAGEGESCINGGRCQTGLVCLQSMDDQENYVEECGHPSGEGGPCGRDGECGEGLTCDWSSYPGACTQPTPPAGEGEPCDPGGEQSSCGSGLVCVPANDFQSASCMKPKAKGQACTKLFECGGLFSLGICDTTSKKCVDRPTSGPCIVPDAQLGCDFTKAYCDTSDEQNPTCRTFKAPGAECTDDPECGSMFSNTWCEQSGPNSTGTCTKADQTVCTP